MIRKIDGSVVIVGMEIEAVRVPGMAFAFEETPPAKK
jgi:hypothetical protein